MAGEVRNGFRTLGLGDEEKNDWDANERRFSGFYQAKNGFRCLSALIRVNLRPLCKKDFHNFLSNENF